MNIVITGTGKGIGFELVKLFISQKEVKVFAISRHQNELIEFKKSLTTIDSNRLEICTFDLGQERRKYIGLINDIVSKMGNVDILINNAGLLINKSFTDLTDDDFDGIFNINLKAVFKLTQLLIPHMNEGSHIVNISSMGGFQGSDKFNGLSLYSASKGALAIFSECMAIELKDKKISVNCLALGSVQTDMLTKAFPNYRAPLKATEIAVFITNFSQNGHKFFNGKIIPVSLSTP